MSWTPITVNITRGAAGTSDGAGGTTPNVTTPYTGLICTIRYYSAQSEAMHERTNPSEQELANAALRQTRRVICFRPVGGVLPVILPLDLIQVVGGLAYTVVEARNYDWTLEVDVKGR